MGAGCCRVHAIGVATSHPSFPGEKSNLPAPPNQLSHSGSCDSGLSSQPCSLKDSPLSHPHTHHIHYETHEESEKKTKSKSLPHDPVPFEPAPFPMPRSIIFDPRKTHENFLRWSKTRIDSPGLSEADLPQALSNISLRIVTPNVSGVREMGRVVEVLDDRLGQLKVSDQSRPVVEPGTLWTDYSFTKHIALEDLPHVEWKRPKDICLQPVLFADGASRYDIGQGSAGTCWFLCILTSLADKPEYLSQIIPADAYLISGPDYDGIFHCRLWKLGSWHDVYIDDFLPVHRPSGKVWGAHSATNDNEMWVALMEKAFAKFHGSYTAVKGGSAGDAFVTLTGGVEEDLHLDNIAPLSLFSRMDNALNAGAILACSVPVEHDGIQGLSGGHAYTINGIAEVPYRGRMVPLIRLRNPWGNESGEWRGGWSDSAPQWLEVSPAVKTSLAFQAAGDGEFWMSLSDFYKYIWRAFVCNFTPDFNSDGYPNGLDQVWSILGEWSEAHSNDNPSLADRFQHPKYTFTITESQHTDIHQLEDVAIGMCPIVIQFLQEDIDSEFLYIRCDLYRVEQKWVHDDSSHLLLTELTNDKVYIGAADVTYRYVLPPGRYVIIPTYSNTRQPQEARTFCLRVFTTQTIHCISVDWSTLTHVFLNSLKTQHQEAGHRFNLPWTEHWLGEWRQGMNAGGQACRPLYYTNPQFTIHIPTGAVPCQLGVCVSQELCQPVVPLGVDIYKVPVDGIPVPLDQRTLSSGAVTSLSCRTVGGSFVFIRGYNATGYYTLTPGFYVMVAFSNDVTDEKKFTVTLATNQPITCRAFQELSGPTKEED